MCIWRRMLKISWLEHKTNDEVLQCAEEQRTLMTPLRQRQKMVGTLVTLCRAQFVLGWVTVSRVQLKVPENLSQYITSHPGQLSLAIPPTE